MTTLLPVAEAPPPADPPAATQTPAQADRATFGTLVEQATRALNADARDTTAPVDDKVPGNGRDDADALSADAMTTGTLAALLAALGNVAAQSAPRAGTSSIASADVAVTPIGGAVATTSAKVDVEPAASSTPSAEPTDPVVGTAIPTTGAPVPQPTGQTTDRTPGQVAMPTAAGATTAPRVGTAPAAPTMPLAPAPTTPIDDATGTAAATETDTPSVPAAPTGTLELEDAHRPAEADPTATHRTGAPLHVPHDQGAPPTHDVEAETAPRPSAPAPDARPEPVAPWEQLARAVQTARRHQDGSHTMTVRLDPPELGTVELHLRVHDGQLSVHALTDSLATRDVISRALPDLRAALESGGLHAGSLDVGARSSGQGPEGRNADNAPGGMRSSGGGASSRSDDVSVARASRGTSEPSSRLDLRL